MSCESIRPLRRLLTVTAVLVPAFAGPSASAADAPVRPNWLTDFAQAQKAARTAERPLLIHFHADWCAPCRKMERETLSTRALAAQVAGNFVLVKIDVDKHPDLAKRFGVKSLPSDLFVDPGGRILSRNVGYRTQRRYLALVARMDADFRAAVKVRAARSKRQKTAASQTKKKTAPAERGLSAAKQQKHSAARRPHAPPARKLIGLDGYSPVALHRRREWKEGRAQFARDFQGITYWMADAAELRDFDSNPRQYAPQLLGCDPVVLNETDRAVPGRIDYGAFFDGRLFFFVSAASRAKFRRNPLRYTRTRHVLRVDQIEGTAWR